MATTRRRGRGGERAARSGAGGGAGVRTWPGAEALFADGAAGDADADGDAADADGADDGSEDESDGERKQREAAEAACVESARGRLSRPDSRNPRI